MLTILYIMGFAQDKQMVFRMLTTRWLIPLLVLVYSAKAWDEKTLEYAYFGEVEKLKQAFPKRESTTLTPQSLHELSLLATFAVRGRQPEVLRFVFQSGYPFSKEQVQEIFAEPEMTISLAQTFFEAIPGFRSNYGGIALLGAERAQNFEVVKFLINKGVDLNDPEAPSLGWALFTRDTKLIKLLMDAGADPYRPVLPRLGPSSSDRNRTYIDGILELKSATLLKLLDRDRKYTKQIRELEREFSVPANSPFIGSWGYQPVGGGFGSIGLILNEDGTGLLSNDIGIAPCTWKPKGNKATLFVKADSYATNPEAMALRIEGKILRLGTNEEAPALIKYGKPMSRAETEPIYPIFIRFEKACLTVSGEIYVQINGRHHSISLQRLIKASNLGEYGHKIVDDNVIPWADFKKGPIPQTILTKGIPIPFVNKGGRSGYSKELQRLMLDNKEFAKVVDGYDYTLFPCSSTTERYHGEDVFTYILLSKNPLANERDWVRWYLRKSRTNPE